ncbi:hypothetical protein MUU72_32585 [Streptomyces sp. RS10V-4]|uniref:DUF7848 domain-containing protein n=1 Tax=Streptomyces rhizoryzae TaxID=2932493 RepID=UPI00200696DF|nr:hypothetical protein [Streptomyces rhizoryzae]MCK7627778.1 hypothetical protein [Streptomyces rhizoryzae]
MAAIRRFADWVLKVETSGSMPFYEMECMSCDASSVVSEEPGGPQNWALKHAGQTGHGLFRAMHTCFFRAVPKAVKQ